MSRRLAQGLQQALCRSFAAPQSGSHVQPLTACSVFSLLPSLQSSSARTFSASAAQPLQPAVSVDQQAPRPAELDTAFPLLQQSAVPEDQYSFVARTTTSYCVRRKPVFAVVELGPTQFKVTPDDLVYSERLKGVDVGDKISLNRVLLLGNRDTTVIGRPLVPDASVIAIVEEQFLNGKVLIFKKKRRKNSRTLNGHRQALTGLRIMDIQGLKPAAETKS